jgi:hypothetical protein
VDTNRPSKDRLLDTEGYPTCSKGKAKTGVDLRTEFLRGDEGRADDGLMEYRPVHLGVSLHLEASLWRMVWIFRSPKDGILFGNRGHHEKSILADCQDHLNFSPSPKCGWSRYPSPRLQKTDKSRDNAEKVQQAYALSRLPIEECWRQSTMCR